MESATTRATSFLDSTLSVERNAVKSILFRTAALFLQFFVFRLFSYISFRLQAFTSYLILMEDYIQRLLYVFSRGPFSVHSIVVILFTLCFVTASLYDTLLWGLDQPGYVLKTKLVKGSEVTNKFLERPSYVVQMHGAPGEVDLSSVEDVIGSGLFEVGFNFTLTDKVDKGTRRVGKPLPKKQNDPWSRIWLDDEEGMTVASDQWYNFNFNASCPIVPDGTNGTTWDCQTSSNMTQLLMDHAIGMAEVVWKHNTLGDFLNFQRSDNIWFQIGKGGASAKMKQIFSVTKGTRRDIFMLDALKVTLFNLRNSLTRKSELEDLYKRLFDLDTQEYEKDEHLKVAEKVYNNQYLTVNTIFGRSFETKYSTGYRSFETIRSVGDASINELLMASLIRNIFVNVTLLRTDKVTEPIPFSACPERSFYNYAKGGKTFDTDCSTTIRTATKQGSDTTAQFLGEVDTKLVFVMSGIVGDNDNSTSAGALNQTTVDWLKANDQKIQDLMIARAYLQTVDPNLVQLFVQTTAPAISYLQILLVGIPILVAAIAWFAIRKTDPYYQNTLYANLLASAHKDHGSDSDSEGEASEKDRCGKPTYVKGKNKEVSLVRKDGHVGLLIDGKLLKLADEDLDGSRLNTIRVTPGEDQGLMRNEKK